VTSRNDLVEQLSEALGTRVVTMVEAGGDSFSAVFRVTLETGRPVFVKTRSDGLSGMYDAEAHGLAWLAETRAARVPEVLAVRDPSDGLARRFIALTWIDQHLPAPDHDEQLGRDLARLHKSGAPTFGLDRDNFIATIPQSNTPHDSWTEFYAVERLEPMMKRAVDSGHLPAGAEIIFERLLRRLPSLIDSDEPPARLHGDLWRGNVLAGLRGEPWLIDPSVYGGNREIDLAMMRLFGGFGDRVFEAYDEAFPLEPGHAERIALYQLYPLLVHVLLFGGAYAASAMEAASRYVR
jgi:fructosamine-3-kinase